MNGDGVGIDATNNEKQWWHNCLSVGAEWFVWRKAFVDISVAGLLMLVFSALVISIETCVTILTCLANTYGGKFLSTRPYGGTTHQSTVHPFLNQPKTELPAD